MGSAEFLGEQLDIVSVFSVADLFLLPSWQESFGLAALEAMACGVPVVASRVGGLPEVIEHGRTGLLYDRRTSGSLPSADPAPRSRALIEDSFGCSPAGRREICTDVSSPVTKMLLRLVGASARAGSA